MKKQNENKKPVIIAYLGKGGSGKSILSALTGKIAIAKRKKILYIDADPAMGLATVLGIDGFKTIGKAREEIIQQAKISGKDKEKERISDIIDYLLLEALYETPEFSMLIMGQTNNIGCYCPINNLLKDTIEQISSQYDVVIIDAEAGIEQVNRQVTESVHYPVIVTDNSVRGVRTAILVKETLDRAPKMTPIKTGVLFNRIDGKADQDLLAIVKDASINFYGSIPADPVITDRDRKGLPALEMPEEAISIVALKKIVDKEDIL